MLDPNKVDLKVVTGLPIFGSFIDYKKDRLQFLRGLHRRYGDFIKFRMMNTDVYLVSHPDDVSWVMQKNAKNYKKGGNLNELFGQGLFTSEGELWRTQRRLLQPVFHQSHINAQEENLIDAISHEVARLAAIRHTDLANDLMRLAFINAGLALFGADILKFFNELVDITYRITNFITKRRFSVVNFPLAWHLPSHEKFRTDRRRLDEIVFELVANQRQKNERGTGGKNILSLLLDVRDSDGKPMNENQLRDEVVTLLLAGYETTGNTLAWCMHGLLENSEWMLKVYNEIDQKIGKSKPTIAQLDGLTMLDAVLSETLRCYPTAWAWTRIALDDDVIREVTIPKNSTILIAPLVLHRHEKYWKNPDQYDPSRFLDAEFIHQLPKGLYMPFGFGPRTCIGKPFAWMEMKLILTVFFQRIIVSKNAHTNVIADPKVTLGLKHGLQVALQERGSWSSP